MRGAVSFKITFLFAVTLLLAAAVGFLIVFFWIQPEPSRPPIGLPIPGARPRVPGALPIPSPTIGPFAPDFSVLAKPFLGETVAPVLEPFFPTLKPLLPPKIETLLPTPPRGTVPLPGSEIRQVPPPPPRPLTEVEIFNRLWPREYLGYLRGLERLEIRDGVIQATDPGSIVRFGATPRISSEFDEEDPVANWVIPPGERHAAFATDQDVYDSLMAILRQAHQNGLISDEEFERFRRGLTENLPRLIKEERKALREGRPSSLTLPADQRFTRAPTIRQAVRNLLDGIVYTLFLANPADAFWVTIPPICYKDDAPFFPVLGFSAASFCCNCGIIWNCGKSGCIPVFVPDCAPHSVICDIPLGCLNAVCKVWPNAIWDPMTGICGCG